VEWFPLMIRIILEQLKETNIIEDKTHSFAIGNEPWSPDSLQRVEDHIQDPRKENEILLEVAIMVAFLNDQGKEFGNRPITQESIKSQRQSLLTRHGKGGVYLKKVIVHNIQLKVAELIATDGGGRKALQHKENAQKTEALAEEVTANI